MKRQLAYILVPILLLSCGKNPSSEPGKGNYTYEPLTEKAGYPFMGVVSCEGVPVEGVVMSDGVNVTKTDRSGRYWLAGPASGTDFILLSTPGGYETAADASYGTIPMNFARVNKSASGVQRFDFALKKADQSTYNLIVFADMHLSGRNPSTEAASTSTRGLDYTQFEECVEFSNSFASGLKGPVYGVNLGDMTHSQYWYSKNASFKEYLEALKMDFPVYNIIGNHDHDNRTATDYEAGERYRQWLGPTYYSFNIGTQHYIAIDNMVCTDGDNHTNYKVTLDDTQLAWLEKDIKAAPDSVSDFVLLTHVPLASLEKGGNWKAKRWMSNMNTVLDLFGDRKVTVLSGHIHTMASFPIRDNVMQYSHTSICGTWWYTLLCHDGTPASIEHYRFSGSSFRRQTLPFGKEYRGQLYRVYAEGITTQSGYTEPTASDYASAKAKEDDRSAYQMAVNLNLYEWQPNWTVSVYENGVQGSCEPVWRQDLDHRALCDDGTVRYKDQTWCRSIRTCHMLQYVPKNTGSLVSFSVSDENGKPKYMIENIRVQ